ncbi:MAG: hypothetical protein ACPGJH_09540, partial [Alphaproteobacteria bacterium]
KGHLEIKADGIDGVMRTELGSLNVINTASSGDFVGITLVERDDLSLVGGEFGNHGLVTSTGSIDISITERDKTLTLAQGRIAILSGDGDIDIVADDVDFVSGNDKVQAVGEFRLRSQSSDYNYRLGSAAQSSSGFDYTANIPDGDLSFGMRDLSALRDGFSRIRIGHTDENHKVVMRIGDIEDKSVFDYSFHAKLTDDASLVADTVYVVGDVQSSQDLDITARLLRVERQNIHDAVGSPDAGISAQTLDLVIEEQVLQQGWLKAVDRVDIQVTNTSTGADVDNFVTIAGQPNSLTMDMGSLITTSAAGGTITINASQSLRLSGLVKTLERESRIVVIAGTHLNMYTGGNFVADDADSHIDLQAAQTMLMSLGTVVLADKDGSTATFTSAEEMRMNGAIKVASDLTFNTGPVTADYAAYFDTLPGKTLESRNPAQVDTLGSRVELTDASDISSVIGALSAGTDPTVLRNLMASHNYTLGAGATFEVAGDFSGFSDLTDAQKNEILLLLGYTEFADGGFYNAQTNNFVTSLADGRLVTYNVSDISWGAAGIPTAGLSFDDYSVAQQEVVANHLGYTRIDGTLLYTRNQLGVLTYTTQLIQGPDVDYTNNLINWGDVASPASDADFSTLTLE